MKTTTILLLVSLWGMPSPLHAQPKGAQTGKVPTFESLGYQAVKMEPNARQSRWLVPVSINLM